MVALMVLDVPPASIVTPAVDPFQRIWALVAKLLPVAVRVKSAEPVEIEVGLIELSVGVVPAPAVIADHALTRMAASNEPSPVARS
jgi:hypothetical protein